MYEKGRENKEEKVKKLEKRGGTQRKWIVKGKRP